MITNSEAQSKRVQELRTALEQECGSFGIVSWSDEDIVTALIGQGIYPSPENIAAVKNSRLVQHIDDRMTETGWELIYETVGDVDFKPRPSHNFKPELSRRYELSGEDWEHIKSKQNKAPKVDKEFSSCESQNRAFAVIALRCLPVSKHEDEAVKPIGKGKTVSSVLEDSKCERCGFEFGCRNFDCRTGEWEFDCFRCGFQEYLEAVANEDGEHIGWRRELIRAYGAQSVAPKSVGITRFRALRSAKEIEQAATSVREGIATGVLAPESYVTRWDEDTKTVLVIAGKWNEPNAS